ncbi:MAG: type IX secretion system membrane protein PorP/SprF [Bacteroidetes bacterium]|nr:type IX secretion system membrane protein PorP/SprF [Bacteroidota bacterium]
MKKLILLLLVLLSIQGIIVAQNDVQFSNYMFSEISYNPAMTGNASTLDAVLIERQQWVGFDQAPSTQMFNISSYVDKVSGGLGLSIINDKLGYEHSLNAKMIYAYSLLLSEKNCLSMGLGFGMVNRSIKGSELVYDDMTDESAVTTDVNKTKPDFDFGVAFNSEKFAAGFSVTHIDQLPNKATILKVPQHYYLFAKYKFKASEKINIIPSVKFRSSIFITQFDASAIAYYAGKFWLGASYRLNDAIVGLAGVDITKNIRLGYSFDYNSGAVKSYSSGSHEIILLASFNVSKKNIPTKSPRFFN